MKALFRLFTALSLLWSSSCSVEEVDSNPAFDYQVYSDVLRELKWSSNEKNVLVILQKTTCRDFLGYDAEVRSHLKKDFGSALEDSLFEEFRRITAQPVAPHGVTRWAPFAVASALLAVIVAVALSTGAYTIPLDEVLRAITGGPPSDASTVLGNICIPRVVAGMVTGAALTAAGAAYQGMFRNPLVSPDILGVSAGAGFGALLGIYLRLPSAFVQVLAFAGGLAAVSLVMAIGARVRRHDPVLVLVLAGVAMGTLLGAGMSLLKILADPYTQLPAMTTPAMHTCA